MERLKEEPNIAYYAILKLLHELNNTPIYGNLKLQKELFLIIQNFPELKKIFQFESYFLGPHCFEIDTYIKELNQLELMGISKKKYQINQKGIDLIEYWEKKFLTDKEKLAKIEIIFSRIKKFINDIEKNELLTFIYTNYPDFRTESVEYEDLKKDFKKYLISLYKKNKITIGKIAESLEVPFEDIYEELKKKGLIELPNI